MQIFLQYCYSVILNIELHYCKYCKKIIIFYLALSPLSLISVSPSLNPKTISQRNISYLCLSITEPKNHITAKQLAPYHDCLSSPSLSLIFVSPSSNPKTNTTTKQPPSTISRQPKNQNSHSQPSTTEHSQPSTISCHWAWRNQHGNAISRIRDPRITTIEHGETHITNSRSTTHDTQLEQCKYELIMERMKFWILFKPSCEI